MTETAVEPLRHVIATRYVLPLREGGSLPGLVEADDLGMYVTKFRGAGQGRKALIAEIVCAALATALGLRVPELVFVELDPLLGRTEPDQEVQDLLRASAGRNLGIDYLPGSFTFDPTVDVVSANDAAAVLWFDALVLNVDRSWRNPNLLRWHSDMWLIDHGAALYFAHNWPTRAAAIERPYGQASEHVLLSSAAPLASVDDALAARLSEPVLHDAVAKVPDEWLDDEPGFSSAAEVRAAYVEVLAGRLAQRGAWLGELEAIRAAV